MMAERLKQAGLDQATGPSLNFATGPFTVVYTAANTVTAKTAGMDALCTTFLLTPLCLFVFPGASNVLVRTT